MPTRKYEQRLRAEAAEATRRQILDALYERLRAQPSRPASLDEVASAARVARSTIYATFGSRAGLFDALGADLVRDAGYDRLLEAVRDPDPRIALRGGIEGGVQMYAARRDVFRVLHAMARLDPEAVGGAVERMEARRTEGMAWIAERLAEAGALRPGVTVEQAADVVWLVASFDAFDLLYTDRGLPADDVARILVTTAERALYP